MSLFDVKPMRYCIQFKCLNITCHGIISLYKISFADYISKADDIANL